MAVRPAVPRPEWARPFCLHLADGRIWHATEFPSGMVAVNHPDELDVFTIALSLDGLLDVDSEHPLRAARVEWADETKES